MGVWFDCVMQIDGRPGIRTCTTLVRPGMRVVTPRGAADLERAARSGRISSSSAAARPA
jgi:hypothetical protein